MFNGVEPGRNETESMMTDALIDGVRMSPGGLPSCLEPGFRRQILEVVEEGGCFDSLHACGSAVSRAGPVRSRNIRCRHPAAMKLHLLNSLPRRLFSSLLPIVHSTHGSENGLARYRKLPLAVPI